MSPVPTPLLRLRRFHGSPCRAIGPKALLRLFCGGMVAAVLLTASWPALAAPSNSAPDAFEEKVLEVIRKHPAAILEALERFEQEKQQEQRDKQAALIRQLFPVPAQIIGDSPVLGNPEAPLLVEFSDFQCPYCAQAHRQLKALLAQQGSSFKLVYKHFPLSQIHPQALPAARATWAAGKQGKFWQFHDALFSNQNKLGEDLYNQTAKKLGLNLEQFTRDCSGEASLRAISQDLALAERLELQGTPTFLLQRDGALAVISLQDLEAMARPLAQAP